VEQLVVGEAADPEPVEVVEAVAVPLPAGLLHVIDAPPLHELVEREDLLLGPG